MKQKAFPLFLFSLVTTALHFIRLDLEQKYTSSKGNENSGVMMSREQVLEERLKLFDSGCDQYKSRLQSDFRKDIPLLYVPEYKFSYCMLSKTGTSTWTEELAGFLPVPEQVKRESDNKHKWLRDTYTFPVEPKNKESRRHELEKLSTFLFVRHPFARFVSSYRMLKKKKQYTEDGKRVNRIQAQVFPGVKLPDSEDEASFFSAFVDYIISEGPYKYNLHFRPYWFRCDVCEIAVKYIGKLETNWEDKEFILKKFGLPIENGKTNAFNVNSDGETTDAVTMNYMSYLNKTQVRGIYQTYEMDFILFGYDIEPYLSAAKD